MKLNVVVSVASWLERKMVSEQTSDRMSFVVALAQFSVLYVDRMLFGMALPWNVMVGAPSAMPAGYNAAAAIHAIAARRAFRGCVRKSICSRSLVDSGGSCERSQALLIWPGTRRGAHGGHANLKFYPANSCTTLLLSAPVAPEVQPLSMP